MTEYAMFRDLNGSVRQVIVCDRYSGFSICKDREDSPTGFQADNNRLTLIEQVPTSQPPVHTSQPLPPSNSPSIPSSDTTIDVSSTPVDDAVMEDLHINQASKEKIAKCLAGIGKTYATRIVERKPDGGYKSWEHLIEVNPDFNVDWTEVRADTPYVVVF